MSAFNGSKPMSTEKELLADWIITREMVRQRKLARLPKPWSEDRIFQTVRFTNVRREDDKVTRWIADNWRDGWVEHENFLSALVVARMVNRIDSLKMMGYPEVWDENWEKFFFHVSDTLQRNGIPFWGNAYMITTCGVRMSKEQYVLDVANSIRARDGMPEDSLEDAHQWLMRTKGLGSFLAAQILADVRNTRHPLHQAGDIHTWCASGPGSRRGMNYYHQRHPETATTEKKFRQEILAAWEEVHPLLPRYLGGLHMQDFQNCFCEFSKYMRVKQGGRAKNGYPGNA